MVGDKLILKPYHLPPARDIYTFIKDKLKNKPKPFFISISGESGCGKSTLAIALKEVLKENGLKSFILHMDDYFHLPPTSNHIQRLDDINHVGPQEVDLDLMQKHILDIRGGVNQILKPLIHYKENDKRTELFNPSAFDIIIIEGNYVSLLKEIDVKVFMLRTYIDLREEMESKDKDPISPFIESVLEIEHLIIRKHVEKAQLLVDKEYNVTAV